MINIIIEEDKPTNSNNKLEEKEIAYATDANWLNREKYDLDFQE